ncbi:hypothetical protein INT47_008210 [Mucor saturninus]|uniref:Uncharacterized protein n=1 Tax=Mucor saturninus TaxID=64648 RepID=A0A8H7V4W9_9FUNG|nr:hypothetical protein INT47_008210 [Mucor saturninus]
MYRMNFSNFERLVNDLSQHPAFDLLAYNSIPAYIQISCAIWRLANCHIGYRTSNMAFGGVYGDLINWPMDQQKVEEIQTGFEWPHGQEEGAIRRLPKAIGALDGKNVVIECPRDHPEHWRDRKGNFAMKLTAICDNKCRFTYILVGDSDSVNLKTFSLPKKYFPGTDLMSKLLLIDKDVINLVVSTVFGPNAKDQYTAIPTEWVNFTRSDVAYEPVNCSSDLPRIIIEIQNKADMHFYQRLIDYSRLIVRQYKASKLPIAVASVINSTNKDLIETEIPGSHISTCAANFGNTTALQDRHLFEYALQKCDYYRETEDGVHVIEIALPDISTSIIGPEIFKSLRVEICEPDEALAAKFLQYAMTNCPALEKYDYDNLVYLNESIRIQLRSNRDSRAMSSDDISVKRKMTMLVTGSSVPSKSVINEIASHAPLIEMYSASHISHKWVNELNHPIDMTAFTHLTRFYLNLGRFFSRVCIKFADSGNESYYEFDSDDHRFYEILSIKDEYEESKNIRGQCERQERKFMATIICN